jgi:hypothetical protein
MEELKTSAEWETLVPTDWKLKILDPDGWDRKNYQYSFFEELITQQEFVNRVFRSTVQCDIQKVKGKW